MTKKEILKKIGNAQFRAELALLKAKTAKVHEAKLKHNTDYQNYAHEADAAKLEALKNGIGWGDIERVIAEARLTAEMVNEEF